MYSFFAVLILILMYKIGDLPHKIMTVRIDSLFLSNDSKEKTKLKELFQKLSYSFACM